MMGSGKTTIGTLLSEKLNLEFIDMDEHISLRLNMNIYKIFIEKGESFFRDQEVKLLDKLSRSHGKVISTGGGVILSDFNRSLLKNTGFNIFLYANIDTILKRLDFDYNNRPLLYDYKNLNIHKIWDERKKYYYRCADLIINSSMDNPEIITEKIKKNFSFLCE